MLVFGHNYFVDFFGISDSGIWGRTLLKSLTKKTDVRFFKKNEIALSELFSNCERERVLEAIFKYSKWVQVQQDNSSFSVGVIYKNNQPNLIGIAIASNDINALTVEHKIFGKMRFFSVGSSLKFGYFVKFLRATDGLECTYD